MKEAIIKQKGIDMWAVNVHRQYIFVKLAHTLHRNHHMKNSLDNDVQKIILSGQIVISICSVVFVVSLASWELLTSVHAFTLSFVIMVYDILCLVVLQ